MMSEFSNTKWNHLNTVSLLHLYYTTIAKLNSSFLLFGLYSLLDLNTSSRIAKAIGSTSIRSGDYA